jgi:predicted patatin/cPLA2 family phospholipase
VGALRALYEHLPPETFGSITAVSASVFASSYFVAHQVDEMEGTWRDRVHGAQLVRFGNLVSRDPVIALDYLVELFRGPVRLDLRRLVETPTELRFVVTNYATGQPEYVRPSDAEVFDAMRASCAVPGLYPIPVEFRGTGYFDGARSDPLPVEYVLGQGYRRLLVIMTAPLGYRKKAARRWGSALFIKNPAARRAFLGVHRRYNRALELIANPPAGVTIDVIAPSRLPVANLSRNRPDIIAAIELGKVDAHTYMSSSGPRS